MTDSTRQGENGTDEPTTGGSDGSERRAYEPSRRAFVAAAVGTSAAAFGAFTGSVTAQEDDGDETVRGIETPWLERDGNLLFDPEGNRVILRGVNVVDPARAEALPWRYPLRGIDYATDPDRGWYARIIRIPVQTGDVANVDPDDGSVSESPVDEVDPGEWSEAQLEAYVEHHLRPAVEYCEEVGVYCIVDYHRHDDPSLEYTDPDLHEEVTTFWDTVAPEFADDSHVLYEVYNEPIGPYAGEAQHEDVDVLDDEAEDTWLEWRETAQPWVDTIRDHAERNVIIIGSPRWSQWTYWAPHHEFDGENLAYAAHVYTHENLRPLSEYFGEPAEEVPVFLSEFGYQNASRSGHIPDFLEGTTSEHGAEFEALLDEYEGIHPQIWCFDPFWEPAMFDFDDATHEWSLMGGEDHQGEWWREYLYERRDEDVPATRDARDRPPAIGGVDPTDPDDDGLYDDLTGDGETDHEDVTAFFEHLGDPAVQENSEYFDFVGNDDVGFNDVLALFERIQ